MSEFTPSEMGMTVKVSGRMAAAFERAKEQAYGEIGSLWENLRREMILDEMFGRVPQPAFEEHRCDSAPEYGPYPEWTALTGWRLEVDAGADVPVNYCPYCGERLE